jgi:hypothetical protein
VAEAAFRLKSARDTAVDTSALLVCPGVSAKLPSRHYQKQTRPVGEHGKMADTNDAHRTYALAGRARDLIDLFCKLHDNGSAQAWEALVELKEMVERLQAVCPPKTFRHATWQHRMISFSVEKIADAAIAGCVYP